MLENINSQELKKQFQSNKILRFSTYALGGLVLVVAGYLLYYQFVRIPKEKKSENSYWYAMNMMEKDSTDLVIQELNTQIKKYDGLKGSEVSQFMLARQYMNKGEFDKALKLLDKVKLKDSYVSACVIGLQGDCYSEQKKYKEAASKYQKAARKNVNEWTTPMFLMKAGLCAEELQDFEAAHKLYEEIKNDYTTFANAKTIDKYIARVAKNK